MAVDLARHEACRNGEPLELLSEAIDYRLSSTQLTLLVNWPLLLKGRSLPPSPNFTISGIADGAGNPAAPIDVPLTLPDTIAARPLLTGIELPDGVMARPPGILAGEGKASFKPAAKNEIKLVRSTTASPYVSLTPNGSLGELKLGEVGEAKLAHASLLAEVRIPKTAGSAVRLYAELESGKTKRVVNLNKAAVAAQKDQVAIEKPVPGDYDVWHTLNLPVGKLWQKGAEQPVAVSISGTGIAKKQVLQLRNVWLLEPWQAPVRLSGISASPVAAYECRVVGSDGVVPDEWQKRDGLEVGLDLLRGKAGEWLEVRLVDADGNVGVPMRLPRL